MKVCRYYFNISIIILLLVIFYLFTYNCSNNEQFENIINIEYIVIHIDTYKDRYQNILNNQTKLKQDIKIFNGIVGKTLDLNNLKIFDPKLSMNFKYSYINEIGCYLSHLMLIKTLLNKSEGYTVIFEDDFDILDNNLHTHIIDIINKVSDEFDIIFLGNLNNNYGKNIIDNIYSIDKNKPLWGTHGYLINNKHATKIYNKLLNMDLAIDNKFKKLIDIKEINGLTIYPILVNQQLETYNSTIR